MRYKTYCILIFSMVLIAANGYAQNSQTEVMKVVNTFFDTMEKKDSVGFNNLFLENAYAYSLIKKKDSIITRSSILKASSSKNNLKEQLREKGITIHINNNIAAVWAQYDFWVNGVHSHCGYEVFTLLKKQEQWKIASLTYTVEKNSCNE